MCVTIGVDPLASNKGIWNRLLGFGGAQGCMTGLGPTMRGRGMLLVLYIHPRRGSIPAAHPISAWDCAGRCVHANSPKHHSPYPPHPRPLDFYYELGVQCVETCLVLRSSVGALVELNLLLRHIQARDRSGARCHSCQSSSALTTTGTLKAP